MKYGYVCVAGTFDGLHRGHEALLERAFSVGTHVLIGLTSDAYLAHHKPASRAAPYSTRFQALSLWISEGGYEDRVTIVPIHDPFGPAVTDKALEALVVSEQTLGRADELNRMRVQSGRKPLILSLVPMIRAQDNQPISTTRVKNGVIDRFGRLTMPDTLRNDLTVPLGVVLSGDTIEKSMQAHKNDSIISVGDQTTKTLLEAGLTPRLMIIDNKVNRREFLDLKPIIVRRKFDTKKIVSGPGFISGEALQTIRNAFSHHQHAPLVIDVTGEEDLLALPAIIEAPIGSVVYYGQPPIAAWACGPDISGVVEVSITNESKAAAKALLIRFIQ